MDLAILVVGIILTSLCVSVGSFCAGVVYERRNWNIVIWGNDHPRKNRRT